MPQDGIALSSFGCSGVPAVLMGIVETFKFILELKNLAALLGLIHCCLINYSNTSYRRIANSLVS